MGLTHLSIRNVLSSNETILERLRGEADKDMYARAVEASGCTPWSAGAILMTLPIDVDVGKVIA